MTSVLLVSLTFYLAKAFSICCSRMTLNTCERLKGMSEKKRIEFVSSMAQVQKQHVHPSVRKVFGGTAGALAGLLERIERLEQQGQQPEEAAEEESEEEPENAAESSPE